MHTRNLVGFVVLSSSLILSACGDGQKSQIDEALAAKFDSNLCFKELKQFPYVARPKPRDWLQPMVDDGLLDMEERKSKTNSASEYIYTMTEKALKYSTNEGHFCYGTQRYEDVEGLPDTDDGFKPGMQIPVKVIVNREITADWAEADVLKNKVQTGEFILPAVLIFKQDGSISVFK